MEPLSATDSPCKNQSKNSFRRLLERKKQGQNHSILIGHKAVSFAFATLAVGHVRATQVTHCYDDVIQHYVYHIVMQHCFTWWCVV